MQLLATKPAAEISLREVARAADVSHNAPYHHFADRRGLLKTLAERSMAQLVADVRTALERADDPTAALVAAGQAYIRFALERSNAFDVIYDPTVCVPGSPSEAMAPLIAELEQRLAGAVVAAGLSDDDATPVWGLVHGLGTLAAAGHFPAEVALGSAETAIRRMLSA